MAGFVCCLLFIVFDFMVLAGAGARAPF